MILTYKKLILVFDSEEKELHLEDILGTESDVVNKGIENETDKGFLYHREKSY